jgi:hypothetical protein
MYVYTYTYVRAVCQVVRGVCMYVIRMYHTYVRMYIRMYVYTYVCTYVIRMYIGTPPRQRRLHRALPERAV